MLDVAYGYACACRLRLRKYHLAEPRSDFLHTNQRFHARKRLRNGSTVADDFEIVGWEAGRGFLLVALATTIAASASGVINRTTAMRKATQIVAVVVLLSVHLFTTACSDDDVDSSWDLDEPLPAVEINSSYCPSLAGDALDEPRVTRESSDRWRIRYPAFEEGCGAYQLDAVVDFDRGERDGEAYPGHTGPTYVYEVSACNRCESTQTWNYLFDFSGSSSAPADLEVPPQPRVEDLSDRQPVALLMAGQPIVVHGDASAEDVVPENACIGTGASGITIGGVTWVSYGAIRQVRIEPDQLAEFVSTYKLEEISGELLEGAASDAVEGTTILWPRLFPAESSVTGADAASAPEYCVEQVLGRAGNWVRPYDVPYRVEDKYHLQPMPAATLPPELVERLSDVR
jgi:hypothetical protein